MIAKPLLFLRIADESCLDEDLWNVGCPEHSKASLLDLLFVKAVDTFHLAQDGLSKLEGVFYLRGGRHVQEGLGELLILAHESNPPDAVSRILFLRHPSGGRAGGAAVRQRIDR